MKFISYIPTLGMTVSLLMATAAALAAGPSYRLAVDGLACPFCAYGIEKKLSALAGVERLETDIEDGSVIVTMQDGATLEEAAAQQAVKAAGFSLRTFEQVAPGAPEGQ